jgi:hypothetical protein
MKIAEGGDMWVKGVAAALAVAVVPAVHSPIPVWADMQARRAHDFVNSVGVNTHFSWSKTVYDSAFDQLKAALADLGIKHIRQSASSPLSVSRIADLNESLGIRALMVVDNFKASDFGARELDPGSVPEQIDDAIKKLGANAFSGVEGPNEYNATLKKAGNTDWAQDLRTYAAAIYQTVNNNPAISALPVVAPSLARNDRATFEELGNLSSISDAGNLHAYSGERPLDTALGDLLQLVSIVNPGQPILVTEYGLQTAIKNWQAHPFTDMVKAKYLARSIAAIFARPEIERGFIYQLADEKANPAFDDPGLHFGLLRSDVSPTMAYYAVRNMMHLLCDADSGLIPRPLKASLSGDMQNVRSILLQKGSGVFYLVLWQEVASYEKPKPANALQYREWTAAPRSLTLTFGEPIAGVRTYLPSALDGDADGGKKPRAAFDEPTSVSLDVPDELLIVEIIPAGASSPEVSAGCSFTPSIR